MTMGMICRWKWWNQIIYVCTLCIYVSHGYVEFVDKYYTMPFSLYTFIDMIYTYIYYHTSFISGYSCFLYWWLPPVLRVESSPYPKGSLARRARKWTVRALIRLSRKARNARRARNAIIHETATRKFHFAAKCGKITFFEWTPATDIPYVRVLRAQAELESKEVMLDSEERSNSKHSRKLCWKAKIVAATT